MNEHLARAVINLLAIAILDYMIKKNDLFDDKQRKPLLRVVLAVAIVIIAEAITLSFIKPIRTHRTVNLVFNAVGFGISPFVPLLMAKAFERQKSRAELLYYFPAAINLILASLSPAYGFIYHYSAVNEYFRGPFFSYYVFSYLFGIGSFLIGTLRQLNVYQNKNKAVLLGLVLLTLVGTGFQIVWPGILSTWPTVTLVIILSYTYYNELLEVHDVMTNVYNRRAYAQHLLRFVKGGRGAIILFDVDDFKQVNDGYGHLYGDNCLQLIAGHIRDSFAPVGLAYRIGGDEFSVLSSCMAEKNLLRAEADFLEKMAQARSSDPRIPWVSFGHAFYDSAVLNIDEAITKADQQLFRHKESRKRADRVKHF